MDNEDKNGEEGNTFEEKNKSGRGDRLIRPSHTTVRADPHTAVPKRSQLTTHILLALEQTHPNPPQFIQRVIRQRFMDIEGFRHPPV